MDAPHETQLAEELQQFKEEKEKIRQLVGQIGGKSSVKREKTITRLFVVALLLLFGLDISRHFIGIPVPLPPLFSLELGILLVSVKIIWMIQSQTRAEHFQFWILNSIEFRVNEIAKNVTQVQGRLEEEPTAERSVAADARLRAAGRS